MANSFPLVLDQVSQKIKELPEGDGLDLSGSDISSVNSVNVETSFILPVGDTNSRPSPPAVGMMRFNTDINKFEGYTGNDWVSFESSLVIQGDLQTLSGTEDLNSGDGSTDLNVF